MLGWVYTWGGMSIGADTGPAFQQLVSNAISGPALFVLRECGNIGARDLGSLFGWVVYLGTAVSWVSACVFLALLIRFAIVKAIERRHVGEPASGAV